MLPNAVALVATAREEVGPDFDLMLDCYMSLTVPYFFTGRNLINIVDQVAGIYPKVMIDGDLEAGAWSCGMVAGLIHDVPSCRELIYRIMADATQIIRGRLEGFLA